MLWTPSSEIFASFQDSIYTTANLMIIDVRYQLLTVFSTSWRTSIIKSYENGSSIVGIT